MNPSHRILLCANYVSILIMLCNAICEKSYLQRRKHPTWFKDLPFGLAQLSIPISFCFFSLLIQLLHILFFAFSLPFSPHSSSPLIVFWLIYLHISIHHLTYVQKERKKRKKYTPAQSCWVILCGRRNVDDQTIFTSLLNEFSFSPSLCFSHTSFLASPHSLNLYLLHSSASSFTPFAFSVSRDVSLPSLNSPATL